VILPDVWEDPKAFLKGVPSGARLNRCGRRRRKAEPLAYGGRAHGDERRRANSEPVPPAPRPVNRAAEEGQHSRRLQRDARRPPSARGAIWLARGIVIRRGRDPAFVICRGRGEHTCASRAGPALSDALPSAIHRLIARNSELPCGPTFARRIAIAIGPNDSDPTSDPPSLDLCSARTEATYSP
jgi:hypothetical protein